MHRRINRLIGRYRRLKHRKSAKSLKLAADTLLQQPSIIQTLTLTLAIYSNLNNPTSPNHEPYFSIHFCITMHRPFATGNKRTANDVSRLTLKMPAIS